MIACMPYTPFPYRSLQLGVARGLIPDVNAFAGYRESSGDCWGREAGVGYEKHGLMSWLLVMLSVCAVCECLNVRLA